MSATITLTLSDEAVAALANAILGAAGQPTGQPAITNKTADKAEKKGKAAAPPAEEPAAEEETPAEDAQTDDVVTAAQSEIGNASAAEASLDDMRASVTNYFEASGYEKKQAAKMVADADDDTIKAYYGDYCARLVVDETGAYCASLTEPYIATRVYGGQEVKKWVTGGVTMTDEAVEAAGLGDPNVPAEKPKAPPAPAKPKAPALPKRAARK